MSTSRIWHEHENTNSYSLEAQSSFIHYSGQYNDYKLFIFEWNFPTLFHLWVGSLCKVQKDSGLKKLKPEDKWQIN